MRKEDLPVLKVVQRPQPPLGRHGAEEGRGGLVRSDAGRGQQADEAVRLHQAHGPLHEQGVQVEVAAAEQRIVAAAPRHAQGGVDALVGGLEGRAQGVAGVLQFLDHALAVGGALRQGDGRPSRREPLHLLHLHALPRRVAHQGVKAAAAPAVFRRLAVLPIRPQAGEGQLPVQEALLRGQLASLCQQVAEAGRRRRILQGRVAGGDGEGVTKGARQPGAHRQGVVAGRLQPVQGVQHGKETAQGGGALLDVGEQGGGLLGFVDFGIGQRLQMSHGVGGGQCPAQGFLNEQGAAGGLGLLLRLAHPAAEQAVAAAQVMVQEAQGGADGEAVQPQGQLGELHRHRVLIDAIDAALEHHAAQDLAVVQLCEVDVPAPGLGVVADGLADGRHFLGQGRAIARHFVRLGQGGDHMVAQQIDQID